VARARGLRRSGDRRARRVLPGRLTERLAPKVPTAPAPGIFSSWFRISSSLRSAIAVIGRWSVGRSSDGRGAVSRLASAAWAS
jgi:hypothetical protein